ncbi:MAG: hypothetical protein LUD15_09845 [Bacteroides sp.]|nr:hypothetical protein [Bacteroides sp.]
MANRVNRKIELNPHESKLLVSLWDEAPRQIVVNTLTSGNLPGILEIPVRNIVRENRRVTETEGDFVMAEYSTELPGERIVDNEDPLFFLSEPAFVGLLPTLLEEVEDSEFMYAGIPWWRPPL